MLFLDGVCTAWSIKLGSISVLMLLNGIKLGSKHVLLLNGVCTTGSRKLGSIAVLFILKNLRDRQKRGEEILHANHASLSFNSMTLYDILWHIIWHLLYFPTLHLTHSVRCFWSTQNLLSWLQTGVNALKIGWLYF